MRLLLVILTSIHTLVASAQWTSHLSLKTCSYVAITSSGPVAGNNYGFFLNNLDEQSIISFTKVNHLSDINISTITASNNKIYVGYQNGNIDIVDISTYTTQNIPELKNHNIENKTINKIYQHGSQLYCATNCGLVVVDINKAEIKSLFKIRHNTISAINDVVITNDSIYAATSNGLYRANLTSRILENDNEWTPCNNSSQNICAITIYNNHIIYAEGIPGTTSQIHSYSNGQTSSIATINTFKSLSTDNKYLIIANSQQAYRLDNTYQTVNTTPQTYHFGADDPSTKTPNINQAIYNNGTYYIADSNNGLVTTNGSTAIHTYPNGPDNAHAYNIIANKNGVFCTGGGVTSSWNNNNYNIYIHQYNNGTWHTIQHGQRDALNICYDPNNIDSVYFTTWGNGVFKLENNSITTHYTAANSILNDIFNGSDYTRTSAITFDNEHNLIICQAEVSPGIAVKHPDGEWTTLSYPPTNNLHSTKKLIHTSNGNYWLIIPRTQYAGLMVFNTNNTLDDDSDDLYRCTLTTTDNRDYGKLLLLNEDGEQATTTITDIVEDKTGTIWIGTNIGLYTYNDDKNIFNTPTPIFTRIKVPRNDGTNYADYLLDGVHITCIAVDGANRKWIGTNSNGAYLISSDGLTTIHSFTQNNSPLISDEITSIAIHPSTGEVFFSTPVGIISYSSDATEPESTLSNLKIYPNPVRPSYHGTIKMEGFSDNCLVKITDINGRLVYSTQSLGGTATWNCQNLDKQRVSTGVYIVWTSNNDGSEKCVGKILVIK